MRKIKILYALNIGLNIAVLAIFVIADILVLTKDQSATLSFYLGLFGSAVVISLVNLVICGVGYVKLQNSNPKPIQNLFASLCNVGNGLSFGFAIAEWVTLFEFDSITDLNAGLLVACTYTVIFSTSLAIVMGYLLKKER